jgi:hypothetical protein
MAASLWDQHFQQRLKLDPHTAWARGMSEAHLEGLFWLVGCCESLSHSLSPLLERHPEICFVSPAAGEWAGPRLKLVDQLCYEHFGMDEARRRFAQGRNGMELSDLPQSAQRAVARAAPGQAWDFVAMTEYGFELAGMGLGPRRCTARLGYEGRFSFLTHVHDAEIPAAVVAAFRSAFPDHHLLDCCGVGVRRDAFEHFEVRLASTVPGPPEPVRHVEIGVDGQQVRPTPRGPDRESIFSGEIREQLNLGEPTQWASDLSQASLEGALWTLGAVAVQALPALKPADAWVDLTPWPGPNELDCRISLEGIRRVVLEGERFDQEQAWEFIDRGRMAWREQAARAVPFAVKRAVDKASPRTWPKDDFKVDKTDEHYVLHWTDPGGRSRTATVRPDGSGEIVD